MSMPSFLGTTIVSAAVIDDVIGIVVLTCVLGASSGTGTGLGKVLINTVLFFATAVGVGVVAHFAMTWLDKRNPHTQRITIVSMAFCFAMAYIAEEYFGIADITGAYIAGIVLCTMDDAPYVERRVDISNYIIFAPIFFASIGLKTDISGLTPEIFLFCVCFVIVALITKIIGCGLAAKICRFNWGDSLKIGVGMMTRGEVALIVAQKGLDVGVVALVLYLLHARNNNRALFSLKLFRTRTFSLGLAGSFAGRIGSGMLPFMTPVFLQIGLGFSPFHAGLMMIPMVLGSMGMKRIVVQVVNRFGYRRVLVATTLGLSLVTLLFMTTALLGWYYVLPFVLFLQGMVNSTRFSSMNTLTLKDLPDNLASSGNSLLSMIMQLSMSIGVTIAGLLLGLFGSQHVSVDSGTTQAVFMYTWLSMALIIALPAFIFARVPNDTHQNVAISRRKRSAQ